MESTYVGNASNNSETKNKQPSIYKNIVEGSMIIEKYNITKFLSFGNK